MPNSTLSWRTFRLSLLALTLACGHAVAASRPGVSTHTRGPVRRAPAQHGGAGTPARFVGVGPTAVASSGVRLDAHTRISMPLSAAMRPHAPARPATPGRVTPRKPAVAAATPAVTVAPPAKPAPAAAQDPAPKAVAAATPRVQPRTQASSTASGRDRYTRRASVVTAALSRRPSGGALSRDPFGSAPIALSR